MWTGCMCLVKFCHLGKCLPGRHQQMCVCIFEQNLMKKVSF